MTTNNQQPTHDRQRSITNNSNTSNDNKQPTTNTTPAITTNNQQLTNTTPAITTEEAHNFVGFLKNIYPSLYFFPSITPYNIVVCAIILVVVLYPPRHIIMCV